MYMYVSCNLIQGNKTTSSSNYSTGFSCSAFDYKNINILFQLLMSGASRMLLFPPTLFSILTNFKLAASLQQCNHAIMQACK